MQNKLFYGALVVVIFGCSENSTEIEKKSGEVTSSISDGSLSDEELKKSINQAKSDEEKQLAIQLSTSTTLEFDKMIHDFGNVMSDTDNTTEFVVTNTGDKPLILEDVSASCGCTTPQKPEGPIAPGESDVIKVTFSPKPDQLNEITKSITVTANTLEKVHLLEIRAFVRK